MNKTKETLNKMNDGRTINADDIPIEIVKNSGDYIIWLRFLRRWLRNGWKVIQSNIRIKVTYNIPIISCWVQYYHGNFKG